MSRVIRIDIPVRPKPVQSVRGGRNGFYADPAVRRWKAEIRPYMESACPDGPSDLPMRIRRLTYMFRCPSSAPAATRRYIEMGGVMPYTNRADITDNLNKGLIDVCAGIVFTDDKNIWQICEASKLYGLEDGIHVEFEETPHVALYGTRDPACLPPVGDLLRTYWWRTN